MLVWLIPVLSMIINDSSVTKDLFLLSGIISLLMTIRWFDLSAVVLPYFIVLSPAYGRLFGFILMTDIFVIGLGVIYIFASLKRRYIHKINQNILFVLLLVFMLISSLLNLISGHLISFRPIYYIFSLLIIYLITDEALRRDGSVKCILFSWYNATFYGCLILINSYFGGVSLAHWDSNFINQQILIENIDYLFRASYYYTNFFYLIGFAILYNILHDNNRNIFRLSLKIFYLIVFLISLLLMMNKTAFISLVITLMIISLYRLDYKNTILSINNTFIFLILILSPLIFLTNKYTDATQITLWVDRLMSWSSLIVRSDVYYNAILVFFNSPLYTVFGFGPDFLTQSGSLASIPFKMSSMGKEGTVDSGWLTYIIEIGIVGSIILLTIKWYSLKKCLRNIRYYNIYKVVLVTLIFIILGSFTQVMGFSKISIFLYQLIIIANAKPLGMVLTKKTFIL
jgi:hypothetical protein